MNKQELIESIENLNKLYRERKYVAIDVVLSLVNLLDEPKKIVVPQFVAEHIKRAKEIGRDLQDAMNSSSILKDVDNWLYTDDNMELFARAWLDGYDVEKEKRYIIKFKNIQKGTKHLKYDRVIGKWYFGLEEYSTERSIYHTKKELEDAGFGWVFSCEGIEIEEVE